MVAEVYAGLSSLKMAFDLAKGLKDMDDATRRNAAVIDLQEKILSAQEAQAELVNRARALEEKVSSFEKWDAEKEKYELKKVGRGAYAYALKPNARCSNPPHLVCPNCFVEKKISVIQYKERGADNGFFCPACKTNFSINTSTKEWGDE